MPSKAGLILLSAAATLVGKLAEQVSAVQSGNLGRAEEMLTAQAHTLDLLFNKLVHRSMNNSAAGYLDASETYMRLALRAQSQARATLETLSVVKNPPAVAFVHQANIAHGPQQVNNVPPPFDETSRARESPNPPNRLLEQQRSEQLDTGTPQASVGPDPALEPMEEVNRTTNGPGEGPSSQKRVQGRCPRGTARTCTNTAREIAAPEAQGLGDLRLANSKKAAG